MFPIIQRAWSRFLCLSTSLKLYEKCKLVSSAWCSSLGSWPAEHSFLFPWQGALWDHPSPPLLQFEKVGCQPPWNVVVAHISGVQFPSQVCNSYLRCVAHLSANQISFFHFQVLNNTDCICLQMLTGWTVFLVEHRDLKVFGIIYWFW